MKKCSKCQKLKCLDSFHNSKDKADGKHHQCKACRKEESLKQYNMTLADYDALYIKQEGRCAICGTEDPRGQSKAGRFYVDHNHVTGHVRGLLCHDCNTGLGLFKDNATLLIKGSVYLQERGSYADVN